MSIALRCSPSSLSTTCRHWLTRKCLHSTSALASRIRSEASPEYRENSNVKTSSKKTTGGSMAKELLEYTELTAEKTRGKGRQRLAERPLTKNNIDDFLGHLQTSKHDLTLEDIDRYRPKNIPDPKSSDYDTNYNEVVDSLMRSFSQPQLRQFLQLYDLPRPHHRGNKRAFAVRIVEEKWGWPSLEKVAQDRNDWSEVSERQFPLDPAQSFLLMGKDGTNLLGLSRRYNVSFSFTANPMSLRVQGLKGSLRQIEGYLETLKKDIELDIISLPLKNKLTPEIEQSISRLSGAYVKMIDDTKLSISFLKSQPQTRHIAKRLVIQAATKRTGPSTRAIYRPEPLISSDSSPPPYSLFPFSPPQPLSWQTQSSSTFRYRRIGTWMDAAHLPDPEKPKDLADGFGTMMSSESSSMDVKVHLLDRISNAGSQPLSPVVTVCSGHFLFLSPSTQRGTLVPPLVGAMDAAAALHWVKEYPDRAVFNPSIPKAILSASTHKQQYVRRLVYQAEKLPQSDDSIGSARPATTLTIEIPQRQALQPNVSGSEMNELPFHLDEVSCFANTETSVDILVPDRQTDLRISATNTQAIPASDWPEELQVFVLESQAQAAKSQLDIPLTFTHRGVIYFLHSNFNVRQQHKKVDLGHTEGEFLTETHFNPESGENTMVCKFICEDHNSASGWNNFLRTCHWLTIPHKEEIQIPLSETFSPFESSSGS